MFELLFAAFFAVTHKVEMPKLRGIQWNYRIIVFLIFMIKPFEAASNIKMSLGEETSCAVDNQGAYCWGYGAMGQLGTDRPTTTYTPPDHAIPLGFDVASISIGYWHVCALSTEGSAKCWGSCVSWGLCGNENVETYGATTGSMAELDVIDFGSNVTVDVLAVSKSHSCALSLSVHEVWCFGLNSNGMAGNDESDQWIGDSTGDMGDNLVPADLGDDFFPIDIALGGWYGMACALGYELLINVANVAADYHLCGCV